MRDDTRTGRDGKDPSAPRHLRLIHPAPPTPPAVRRRGSTFTAEQEARIRAALRNAHVLFGTWACLADAMRVPRKTLDNAMFGKARRISGDLAIRLSWALGKTLESLYAAPSDASRCQHCGATRRP